jgi:hypothetical protein
MSRHPTAKLPNINNHVVANTHVSNCIANWTDASKTVAWMATRVVHFLPKKFIMPDCALMGLAAAAAGAAALNAGGDFFGAAAAAAVAEDGDAEDDDEAEAAADADEDAASASPLSGASTITFSVTM